MTAAGAAELDRIRDAYRKRDRRGAGRARSLASVAHQHELEWQVLVALEAAGIDLAGAALLDIGSGGGALLQRLADLGAPDPKGVELLPERVELARANHPGLDIACASATELPFEDGRFEVVTQFTVLSSVHDPEVRRDIAGEVLRVLRPGGVFLSYDVRPSSRVLRLARRMVGGPPRDAGTRIEPLGRADLEQLLGPPERLKRVQLNLDLAEMLGSRRWLVLALRALPPLRSHLIATFRKAA